MKRSLNKSYPKVPTPIESYVIRKDNDCNNSVENLKTTKTAIYNPLNKGKLNYTDELKKDESSLKKTTDESKKPKSILKNPFE